MPPEITLADLGINAAEKALDDIAILCGCPQWEYPGQIVRDVERVIRECSKTKMEAEQRRMEAELGEAVANLLKRALSAIAEGVENPHTLARQALSIVPETIITPGEVEPHD